MHTKLITIIASFFAFLLISCSDDGPIVQGNGNNQDTYVRVATAQNGNLKFELWNASGDSMMTGYNKIGFKVFENDIPKNSGYVRFFPKMYHLGGSNMHGTPVQTQYDYNAELGMFTGYIIMLMPGDSTSIWYGFYNYNDQQYVDSVIFDVGWNQLARFKIFVDLSAGLSYLLTLLAPLEPVQGMNDFKVILHESYDFISFSQLETANMYCKVWQDSLNHVSSGNINPSYIEGGIYSGKVLFDMPGRWKVSDSIYYNNKWITPLGDPPAFVFFVP
jgi:hypothetical protein